MKQLWSRHRTLAGNTSWSLVDQVVTIVGATITFLLLGRTLGPVGYGAYITLYALLGPFLSFGHAGVGLSIIEHILREQEDSARVARSCLGLSVGFAALSMPVIIAIGHSILDGRMPFAALVLLVVADYGFMALVAALAALVQATVGFNAAIRIHIGTKLTRLAAVIALQLAGHLTLTNLAIAQAVLLALQVGRAERRARAALGHPPRPGRVRMAHARSMVVYSVGISSSAVQTDGDKPVLSANGFFADAGRYGAAYRLVLMGLAPVNALIGATHNDFLDSARGSDDQLRKAARLGAISAAYGIVVAAVLWFTAPIVPHILGRDFEGTVSMIRWLSPLLVVRGTGTFPMNGLLGLGKNGLRTIILAANALLSMVLYLALIPAHSWKGALAGTLVSEVALFVCAWAALWHASRTRRAEPQLAAVAT